MGNCYYDFIRKHATESGYGWGKYRWYNGGTTNIWNFYNLEKFKKLIADNADKFVWAMIYSVADGAFYFGGGQEWRKSSGARLAFNRDKAAGRVKGYPQIEAGE